ncbi:hypothetical protein LZC95_15120 [Pendulispora brunnea]|uniref:Phosphoenolpyruvate synthase n=1 Tax=Pendulispora brunnea TaxID=2905690 RepID=A0ABZ2KHK0_9BACT
MTLLVGDGPETLDPILVGNKFARLERMRRAGMRVPDLFCIPAAVFDAALALVRVSQPPLSADPGERQAWCLAMAKGLRELTIPADWAEPLLAAFDTRFGKGARVAVRACVVPDPVAERDGHAAAEDSESDPFAGMSDSFLYVTRDQLLRRIAECWASAFTERAVQYRVWRGLDPTRARVAVGVQHMVEGTRSFVAFTRDPRNGDRCVVIAAAHGIGEGVVQEKADVDHFFVSENGVESELVIKRRMVGRPRDGGGGELSILPVPRELAEAPVLTEAEAGHVAVLSRQVESFFQGPQDIEGTITPDGVIHLVQSRPMVVAKRGASKRLYWCNHNITESYPGISGALTYSQAQEFYRRAFGDLYGRMGVPQRTIDANKHRLEQMVAFLNGRIYYRLDAWQALHGQMPIFELVRPLWEEAMGIVGPAREEPRWSKARALAALPGAMARMLRHPYQVRAFLRWWDELMDGAGDLSGRTPEELIAFYRSVWAQVSVRWGVTLTNSVYLLLELLALRYLLGKWTKADRRLLVGLLIGGPPNRSLRAVRGAIALAEQFAQEPRLKAAILDRSVASNRLWDDLMTERYGASVKQALEEYLAKFGDRALHDLKLEEPTPRQQPWMLLETIRPYVEQKLTVAQVEADERRSAAQAREELAQLCPGPVRRMVLRGVAAGARKFIRMREDTRFCRTQLYGLSREILWSLGDALAKAGRLDSRTDVHDLTISEVLGAFDGTLAGSDLRGLVALRRSEREKYANRAPSDVLLETEADVPLASALERASAVGTPAIGGALHGLGSSAGVVRARAKLVLEPNVTADACQGSILVARETDPGWLFLMMAAKGLVVERGTLLSHTAITGRLLGIPTIVAVPDATKRIPDGAMIEIDGGTGTVRVIESPPSAP